MNAKPINEYKLGTWLNLITPTTTVATVVVGVIRFNQVPNLYSLIGLAFIIIGVLMVNLLGNN